MNLKKLATALLSVAIILSASTAVSAVPIEDSLVGQEENETNNIRLYDSMYNDMQNVVSEYISRYPDYTDLIENLFIDYYSDEEFISHYNSTPQEAIETFSRAIEVELEIDVYIDSDLVSPASSTVIGSGLGVLYYCYVNDTIVQEETTWCGVASTLMALTGIEEYDSNGLKSGYSQPSQSTIASSVYDSSTQSAVVYKISNYLNSKPYAAFDYYSDLSYLSYGHYLVVEDYNSYSNTFTVCDCTYISDYQGRHTQITIDEIYNSLYNSADNVTGRYIIYA